MTQQEKDHWKRNLTVAIVIISVVLIIGFAIYTHLQGIQAHADECEARYEALYNEPIWDQILNYAAHEQEWDDFRIECADVYKMPQSSPPPSYTDPSSSPASPDTTTETEPESEIDYSPLLNNGNTN
jgi:hypothetical protein